MTLSKSQILAADDLPFVDHPVPAWGGSVRVKMMDLKRRLDFESRLSKGEIAENERIPALVVASCVDSDGSPLFGFEDVEALMRKNPDVMAELATAAAAVNKLGKNDVKDAAGNSEANPSTDSPSGSRPA